MAHFIWSAWCAVPFSSLFLIETSFWQGLPVECKHLIFHIIFNLIFNFSYTLLSAHIANVITNWSEMEFNWIRASILGVFVSCDLGVSIYQRYFADTQNKVSSFFLINILIFVFFRFPMFPTLVVLLPASSLALSFYAIYSKGNGRNMLGGRHLPFCLYSFWPA